MADFDWSMPRFESFDMPTWQEISNDREILFNQLLPEISRTYTFEITVIISRRSKIKTGNISEIWGCSQKLNAFIKISQKSTVLVRKSERTETRRDLYHVIRLTSLDISLYFL